MVLRRLPMILAADVPTGQVCAMVGSVELQAAATEGGKGPQRFRMELYNGGPIRQSWSPDPVVVDLEGMETRDQRPALFAHNPGIIVGHTTKVTIAAGRLAVEGVMSGAGERTREIIESAGNGFPWQASMGAQPLAAEHLKAGATATVNGQQVVGPALIVRRSRLMEASFVPLGADDTSVAAMIAASRSNPQPQPKDSPMKKFKAWLTAQGLNYDTLDEAQRAQLLASYDQVQAAAGNATGDIKARQHIRGLIAAGMTLATIVAAAHVDETVAGDIMAAKTDEPNQAHVDALLAVKASQPEPHQTHKDPVVPNSIEAMRRETAAEAQRIADVRAVCAGRHPDIEIKAISEGWSKDKTDLEVLRASRGSAPAFNIGSGTAERTGPKVIEAAAMMATGMDGGEIVKVYDERTVEAAQRLSREFGGFSLNAMFLAAARANGYTGMATKVTSEVLAASWGRVEAAGYSNIDMSGILSNIANKSLLQGFYGVETAWRLVAAIGTLSDLKTHTRYRLTADAKFKKVGAGGEIEAGKLGEESFTIKGETHGRLFGISRTDFINDDLGAITAVPRKLGRGGALGLNDVFWTAWLADSNFFKSANNNYITGATTALSSDGLKQAITKFRRQKDSDGNGNPIGVEPRVLLVSPENEAKALELTRSITVNTGGAATAEQVPNANIYAGRFRVAVSQYLADADAWYLLADPMDIPCIEVAFLNGQQTPFIEQADADFATLGVQMRGYFDFGVGLQDYRGGVKSKGKA